MSAARCLARFGRFGVPDRSWDRRDRGDRRDWGDRRVLWCGRFTEAFRSVTISERGSLSLIDASRYEDISFNESGPRNWMRDSQTKRGGERRERAPSLSLDMRERTHTTRGRETRRARRRGSRSFVVSPYYSVDEALSPTRQNLVTPRQNLVTRE